jgi:hypothetical protein
VGGVKEIGEIGEKSEKGETRGEGQEELGTGHEKCKQSVS